MVQKNVSEKMDRELLDSQKIHVTLLNLKSMKKAVH